VPRPRRTSREPNLVDGAPYLQESL